MQDTERVERVLTDYLRKAEASPTEDGDLEAKAASMAKRVLGLVDMKVASSKVVVLDDTAVVRVTLRGKCGRRTVTAGMDTFAQVAEPAMDEMPRNLIPGAVRALKSLLASEVSRLEGDVAAAVDRLTSDPAEVGRWKAALSAEKVKKVKKERQNLVSDMEGLLAEGWTREMLIDCVDAATCSNVMST